MGKNKHSKVGRWWRKFEYKHTLLAFGSVALFVLTLDTALVQTLLSRVNSLGLVGIFISGLLFVSFFTAAPALVLLLAAADNFSPLTIAIVAGAGSLAGDWIILKIFEERIAYELLPLAKKFKLFPLLRLLRLKIFRPIALGLGILFIMTPLPDEMGVALLGLSHLKLYKLLVLCFILNAFGIYLIVLVARTAMAN